MAAVVAFDGPAAAAGAAAAVGGAAACTAAAGAGAAGGAGLGAVAGSAADSVSPAAAVTRCRVICTHAGAAQEIVLEVNTCYMAPATSGEFPKQLALPKRGGVHCARNSWWAWRAGTAEAQRV